MTETKKLTAKNAASKRIGPLIALLHEAYPDAECALHHKNAFELLVATILSAQCTDERVNKVTPALFARFPTPAAMAEADLAELEELVRSTGFYRNKAKNIQGAARRIVEAYDGEVPQAMDDLLTLPGVARKTANVVRGVCFGLADGVVVDTHVKRLSQRLGLTKQTTPEKIERDLMKLTPKEEWINLSHLLIFHGRQICDARKPKCGACTLVELCPSAQV
ncbi:MAG: endonuclease III [Caldilineaceae bacterium]|nr:endonuclease III [Caldilineaceae bacterium]MCB0128648.1 endonuclease III [Caldilineaceae bacterium]